MRRHFFDFIPHRRLIQGVMVVVTGGLLCGCANTSQEFVVGVALTQNGWQPLRTDMGSIHILGEGTPLY